jgi:hypothetical protein
MNKLEAANMIVTSWAPKFYDTLKNQLMLIDLFRSEYEGIIQQRGDKVKVNSMNLAAAETLEGDNVKFKSSKIGTTQYELTVNRQTVHAVDITNLADLQSESYMEKLMSEMTYQIFLKMEKEAYAKIKSVIPAGNKKTVATGGKYAKADMVASRKAMSKKLIGPNRWNLLSVDYYSDAISDSIISSADFVSGQSLSSQKVPNILGFKTLEHNILDDLSGLFFDPSAFHTVIQKGLNVSVVDKKSSNELAFMVVADIVWDMKEFDTERLFQITG